MHSFLRSLIRGFVRLLFRLGLKLEIEGWENLPPGGPLLIIGNHFSLFEAPMLMVFLPYRERITWLAATELQTSRILKALIDLFNIIPIWRGQPDRTAIHRALDWLAAGNIVGIMPEGGVDETLRPLTTAGVQPGLREGPNSRANPVLITPRPGAAYLAVRSGAPILPAAFLGTEQIMPNLRRLRRTPVRMIIGPVFGPLVIDPTLPKAERRALLDEMGHEMMRHMAALLPLENRGPYG
ncbi:MAG: 1-acyl-sn-glycerol-3-phosphate acyltransferase [Anaerolineae bacterium]|uniref:lysophospholipid acyltransferase family protein n=1 Tax=Promineifilum sp. TaxID=2664178 RepID=UPI001D3F8CE9|nr:1-acyl-sn-glycerol-3-phosphate acyltransferase [Anaerolineales bacterium]MCB8933926.1 1-acyl-sn-glycerol-3-phosphate acyltransferase [Promineifilum sp.]MCO5179327.1 1-acyl-sn-glycerol-3-phosphate acyltransferase [Promineifilum sp.]MCW5848444.1 1-acyl-sn-glycerol-3-phosphate acyltransferase [Anaerolineae bacterium]